MNWKELYNEAVHSLSEAGIEESKSEADIIFEYCFKMNKLDIILRGQEKPPESSKSKLDKIIAERKKGIPIQYILGEWNFRNLRFKVGEGVLIPRDDTNILVDVAIEFLNSKKSPCLIDLCSGSGCVAISLEKELRLKNPEVFGVELSEKAFEYFKTNTEINRSNVRSINGDILKIYSEFCDDKFDAIVSNPPYIRTDEMSQLQKEVKSEPKMALDGGEDGLYFYKSICQNWTPKLKFGGMIAFEIGLGQENEVKKFMQKSGINCIKFHKDINNIVRVVSGIKESAL